MNWGGGHKYSIHSSYLAKEAVALSYGLKWDKPSQGAWFDKWGQNRGQARLDRVLSPKNWSNSTWKMDQIMADMEDKLSY